MPVTWERECDAWRQRSLLNKRYVYVWADGVCFNIRLGDAGNDQPCILVLIGATEEGKKELLVITDGCRESAQSWKELNSPTEAKREPPDPCDAKHNI
jgi:transposase-like protein